MMTLMCPFCYRNLRVAHLKRKAEAELKQGNYGHAAER
jgi:hypothetical protein